MVACILPADNGALQGALSAGKLLTLFLLRITSRLVTQLLRYSSRRSEHAFFLSFCNCSSVLLAVRNAAHYAWCRAMDHGLAVPRLLADRPVPTLGGMLLYCRSNGFRSVRRSGQRYEDRWASGNGVVGNKTYLQLN